MNDDDTCEVPGCEADVEYDSPGKWCGEHWQMWWDWPDDEEQPDWMPPESAD